MKFSTEDCDLFSRKILYPIEQNNTKLKISGMIITICVLFGFCFLFIVYNFIYSFDKINEKIEKQTNILSFYRKSYDYNDINSSINTTLYKDPYYFIAGKVEDYDNKKSEIGEQFYKKKEFCGNVGILGIGVLIIDTITNKHILLNDSNLQLNIKYYNDSNFVDINDVSTYNMLKNSISKFRNNNKKTIYNNKIINFFKIFVRNELIEDYTKELNTYYNLILDSQK